MAITTTNISKLLSDESIKAAYHGRLDQHPQEYTRIFEIANDPNQYINFIDAQGFGLIPQSGEGLDVQYQSNSLGREQVKTINIFKSGYKITREAVDFNQHKKILDLSAAMADAVATTYELVAFNVINNGYDSSFLMADGQPLFSTSHTYSNGFGYSNMLATPADLSHVSYEAMRVQIANAVDDHGKQKRIEIDSLNVSTAGEKVARTLLESSLLPATSNNDKNIRFGDTKLNVSHYQSDANAWFFRTKEKGLILWDQVKPEYKQHVKEDSEIRCYKVYFRINAFCTNPQTVYGSQGA